MVAQLLVAAGVFAGSLIGTLALRYYALSRDIVDVPTRRSSHAKPIPRGGGLAIVLTTLAGFAILHYLSLLQVNVFIALVGGGLAVAAIGFWDDLRNLPARVRILVHFLVAAWALYFVGGVPSLDLGFAIWCPGWFGHVLGAVGLVWFINLYNFMDGIDGLATIEAIFIATAAASLMGFDASLSRPLVILVAACAGFLILNWPPARIFMGDVGSGFLGFAIGVFALTTSVEGALPLWSWIILAGVFLVDATVTLLRRMVRGDRWYEAHRSHAYQNASRRWTSHKHVTLVILTIDIFWLWPLAWLASVSSELGLLAAIIALLPLVVLAFLLGAGTPERAIT